mgnify:FL=1
MSFDFVIDLHGIPSIQEALELLERELYRAWKLKIREGRIVHGIGEGKMAEAVHEVLKKNPIIRSWQEDESGGSCIIFF